MKRLVGFYGDVTGLSPVWYTEDYAEFETPNGDLAIGSKRSMDMYGAGAARAAANRTTIIEFKVDDVDREYDRVKPLVTEFVPAPTTQPWGNRSMLFRDPDGNLVNFFTPVSESAVLKYKD
jgi:catechol 2,3-dioxygenase-like lactoylglutathione lyase family enzyme